MGILDVQERQALTASTERELDTLVTRVQKTVAGQWANVPYRADMFQSSAGSAGTWTVIEGIQQVRWTRIGSTGWLDFRVTGSTVVGTPTQLRLSLPFGWIATAAKRNTFAYLDNSTAGTGIARILDGGTYIQLLKNLNSTAWAAAAGTTSIEGQIALEVRP